MTTAASGETLQCSAPAHCILPYCTLQYYTWPHCTLRIVPCLLHLALLRMGCTACCLLHTAHDA